MYLYVQRRKLKIKGIWFLGKVIPLLEGFRLTQMRVMSQRIAVHIAYQHGNGLLILIIIYIHLVHH